MTKQVFHLGEGFNPSKRDGTPYIDGELIEASAYEDSLVRMGVLVPGEEYEDDSDDSDDDDDGDDGDDGDDDAGDGDSDRLPETEEEFESLYNNMTVAELKEALVSAGVDIPKSAKKADLVDLIMVHQFGGDQ
ncbi:MAG: hypothetical protein JKY61_12915 [Planctomycetes bacterium]|nr:hypothetical protein [Planctomycetota bacterium]